MEAITYTLYSDEYAFLFKICTNKQSCMNAIPIA